MTFFALLTKELRLRMRRERTIWIVIVYILFMGLLGWFALNRYNTTNGYNSSGLSNVGLNLYYLLSQLQLLLIIFVTPAFTATVINGEKERQTFDLLLCSRLSGFSLVFGKLLAGLMNALLLIAASAPLFSLIFFFGGIAPMQVLRALLVYVVTTVLVGTFGMLCSTLLPRPSVSTAITYMVCLLWIGLPLIFSLIMLSMGQGVVSGKPPVTSQPGLLFVWNPVTALTDTYPPAGFTYSPAGFNPLFLLMAGLNPTYTGTGLGTFSLLGMKLSPWLAYTILSLTASAVFLALSTWLVKPNATRRLQAPIGGHPPLRGRQPEKESTDSATSEGGTAAPA
ncbi:MAG TPA: ABC transporter permease [Ktedonosporobacter sp.]|nr:ABC transporter permease [Ktedonosporobacter sp.]